MQAKICISCHACIMVGILFILLFKYSYLLVLLSNQIRDVLLSTPQTLSKYTTSISCNKIFHLELDKWQYLNIKKKFGKIFYFSLVKCIILKYKKEQFSCFWELELRFCWCIFPSAYVYSCSLQNTSNISIK